MPTKCMNFSSNHAATTGVSPSMYVYRAVRMCAHCVCYYSTWKRLPGVMEKAIAQYGNNNSHYDEKVVLDSVTKLHGKENCNATWSLQISESIQLSQSPDYRRPLMWICDQRPAQLRREIQTSNATKSERNTVAWSVVCSTLITPFCLSSTENWAVRTYVRMYALMWAITLLAND